MCQSMQKKVVLGKHFRWELSLDESVGFRSLLVVEKSSFDSRSRGCDDSHPHGNHFVYATRTVQQYLVVFFVLRTYDVPDVFCFVFVSALLCVLTLVMESSTSSEISSARSSMALAF